VRQQINPSLRQSSSTFPACWYSMAWLSMLVPKPASAGGSTAGPAILLPDPAIRRINFMYTRILYYGRSDSLQGSPVSESEDQLVPGVTANAELLQLAQGVWSDPYFFSSFRQLS
jgi:hypothetical protein